MSDDWIRYRELVLQTVKDLRTGIAEVSAELKEARVKMDEYFREQDKLTEKVWYLERRFDTLNKALDVAQASLQKLDDSVNTIKLDAAMKDGDDKVKHTTVSLKLGFVLFVFGLITIEVFKWLVKRYVT